MKVRRFHLKRSAHGSLLHRRFLHGEGAHLLAAAVPKASRAAALARTAVVAAATRCGTARSRGPRASSDGCAFKVSDPGGDVRGGRLLGEEKDAGAAAAASCAARAGLAVCRRHGGYVDA